MPRGEADAELLAEQAIAATWLTMAAETVVVVCMLISLDLLKQGGAFTPPLLSMQPLTAGAGKSLSHCSGSARLPMTERPLGKGRADCRARSPAVVWSMPKTTSCEA